MPQYLGGAEDYHWGNAGYYTPEACDDQSPGCIKDMWQNQFPGTEVIDEIY